MSPETAAAPIAIALPEQSAELAITLAAGTGLTVMVTEFEAEQPAPVVSVMVYVVVMVGETDGFDDVELKPVGLLVQE